MHSNELYFINNSKNNQYFILCLAEFYDSPGPKIYLFSTLLPFSTVYSVTSLVPSCLVMVVFLVVTVFPLLYIKIFTLSLLLYSLILRYPPFLHRNCLN